MTDAELRAQSPPDTLDNTLRCTFDSCRRKFYWFLRGCDYRFTPAYFVFGRVWQIILDTWYDPKIGGDVEVAIAAGQAEWDKEMVEGKGLDTWPNLEKLFRLYAETFPVEPWTVVKMESGWEWPILGTNFFLAGSLDGYIEFRPYGMLALEDKTSGVYLSDTFINQWKFSQQVTQYIWYLTQLLGEEVFGCLMNLACKRIHGGQTPQFARNLETRSEYELEKFVEDCLQSFSDIALEWERWTWTKTCNHIECAGGIGKSPCLYQGLCLSELPIGEIDPFQGFEGIIHRDGPWEPWKRGGE